MSSPDYRPAGRLDEQQNQRDRRVTLLILTVIVALLASCAVWAVLSAIEFVGRGS